MFEIILSSLLISHFQSKNLRRAELAVVIRIIKYILNSPQSGVLPSNLSHYRLMITSPTMYPPLPPIFWNVVKWRTKYVLALSLIKKIGVLRDTARAAKPTMHYHAIP